MKRKAFNVLIVLLVFGFCMSTFMASSSKKTSTDRPVSTKEAEENLSSLQKVMQAESYSEALQWDDLDGEAEAYISGAYSKETLMFLLNTGRMLGYLDDFKAAGLVDQNYVSPYTSSKSANESSNVTAVATPESITTTKCEEKTMWAKSEVNVRENGSTSYKKVASLNKDEQVTVTGIDSTGWYEIRLSNGTVGHVSDKYLTEDDPSVSAASEETATPSESPKKQSEIISIDGRTVIWYNAETDREEEVTFNEETPLEDIEEYANTYLINGGDFVEEATPEPTVEPEETPTPVITATPKESPTVEPSIEPTEEQEDNLIVRITNSPMFIFGSMIVGLIAVITGIVMMINAKKRK